MSIKVFNLCCAQGHRFEGWFGSEDEYLEQHHNGLLECPICADVQIQRVPAAPRLNLGLGGQTVEHMRAEPNAHALTHANEASLPSVSDSAQLQAKLLKALREVVATTEDVGERFAQEARRIHYKEAPERSIRGVASAQEAQALEEEGISITPLPFAHWLKEPLQ